MQCNQAFCGVSPQMYTNFIPGQYHTSFNSNIPLSPPYPELVGEGEVVSVVNPDGSLQYYFLPLAHRLCSNPYGPYRNYCGPYYHNYNPNIDMPAWLIRSISNPIPAAVFNQQPNGLGQPPYVPLPATPDCSVNNPANRPEYRLQFHNDGWTSSTDLHYFFPSLRGCEWIPKVSAAIQVNTLDSPQAFGFTETSNISTNYVSKDSKQQIVVCDCHRSKIKDSNQRAKSRPILKNKSVYVHEKQSKTTEKKEKAIICDSEPNTMDKSVTTGRDQSSGSAMNVSEEAVEPGRAAPDQIYNGCQSSKTQIKSSKSQSWFPFSFRNCSDSPSTDQFIGLPE